MIPTVSVIIPVYNRPSAVALAIRSALSQTFPPLEIIVVDDHSEPPVHVADMNSYTPVRVLRLTANCGAGAARQSGIDIAQGRYVAFLDSDDVWLPGKLKAQMRFIVETDDPMLAVSCGWKCRDEGGRIRALRIPRASDDIAHFASGCWYSPGSTIVLPREAFDRVGPFDSSLRRLEDFEWFLRWARKGGRLRVAPVVGAVIRMGQPITFEEVRHACQVIRRSYTSGEMAVSPRTRARLVAWLALEQARAALKTGRNWRLLYYLVLSFAAEPRATLHMEDWWPEWPTQRGRTLARHPPDGVADVSQHSGDGPSSQRVAGRHRDRETAAHIAER